MDKLNILYAYMGILYSHMKEWTSGTCCNMDDSWTYAKWKKKKQKKPDPQVETILWFHLYEKARVGNP